jgi:hypothetical protein
MENDKPVTNELRARGFGYDIMGLLLAHREDEVTTRLQTLNFGGVPITIAKTQRILDLLAYNDVKIETCATCPEIGLINNELPMSTLARACQWCDKLKCEECSKHTTRHASGNVCADCIRDWCPNCGKDAGECVRKYRCYQRRHEICAKDSCSRCWIRDTQVNPEATGQYETMSSSNKIAITNVRKRLEEERGQK